MYASWKMMDAFWKLWIRQNGGSSGELGASDLSGLKASGSKLTIFFCQNMRKQRHAQNKWLWKCNANARKCSFVQNSTGCHVKRVRLAGCGTATSFHSAVSPNRHVAKSLSPACHPFTRQGLHWPWCPLSRKPHWGLVWQEVALTPMCISKSTCQLLGREWMKGVSNQLLVCSDHRILSNTHFRSHMKHEDELPLIEGLLALKACSNVKRMYSWAGQLSGLTFPYRGERVQRLQRSWRIPVIA